MNPYAQVLSRRFKLKTAYLPSDAKLTWLSSNDPASYYYIARRISMFLYAYT